MSISQNSQIKTLDIFREIANRTGFVHYYGFSNINRTSSYKQEYIFKYYSTNTNSYQTIYP
jgi:hypothetical protein